jgi:endonuclease/exonuclease/phosphatase family metal-dependent hydrolase
VLYELDPDVILMQELTGEEQLAALLARLPGYAGEVASECKYDRHVGALVRERLAPEFEQTCLHGTGRGVVVATFAVNGHRGAALPLHFDVFNPPRRRLQAEDTLALARERPEALVVAGGDLNLDPTLAARVGGHIDAGSFDLLVREMSDGGHRHEPTLMGLLRVDHVFARGPSIRALRTRVSPGRRLPMGDHDPLVCDLDLA